MEKDQEIKRRIELFEQGIALSNDPHQKAMWRIIIQDLKWNLKNAK